MRKAAAKAPAGDPVSRALKAMEKRDNIMKLAADRRTKGLRETASNLTSELQRLHGQQLPGLQAYTAQRRAMLKVVRKKLAPK